MDKTFVLEKVSAGAAVLDRTLDYSYASVEYAGLVLYSYIKRGGQTALEPLVKITSPAWSTVGSMYDLTAQGVRSGIKKLSFRGKEITKIGQRLDLIDKILAELEVSALKETLANLEQRLAYIEQHGIVASKEGGLQLKGKKLSEDKIMFLRAIVKENINLLEDNK
jgi:hypothetical protein